MNPLAMIPAAYRAALYLIAGVVNLVVIYLAATGRAGVADVALVAGIVNFLGLSTAGSNLTRDPVPPDVGSYARGVNGTVAAPQVGNSATGVNGTVTTPDPVPPTPPPVG